MNSTLIVIIATMLTTTVFADEWHNALLATCNTDKNEFKVDYIGKYNEKGRLLVEEAKAKTQNVCMISDAKYELVSKFYPGSPNYSGRCGSHEYIDINILKNGKSIFKSKVEADCHRSVNFISSVTVTNNEKIIVERKLGHPSDHW